MSTLIDAANSFAESLKNLAANSGNSIDKEHLAKLDQAVADLQADDKSDDAKVAELQQAVGIVTSAFKEVTSDTGDTANQETGSGTAELATTDNADNGSGEGKQAA